MTSNERTGWRDERISARHRLWGFDCPAVDIDWLVVEYDRAEPVALIEYKHELAVVSGPADTNRMAIVALGDRAGLPVFCVRYKDDLSSFHVHPWNTAAFSALPETTFLSEIHFVELLYRLRHRAVPYLVKRRLMEGDKQ